MKFTRRQVLRTAAAVSAATIAAPYIFSRSLAQSPELSFWALGYTSDPTTDQAKWFNDLAAGWNNNQSAQVKVQAISSDSVEYYNKLSINFAAGAGPDIFLLSPSDFLRYANAGLLVDLKPYMTASAVADFYPTTMTTREVGDRIYGLPMEVEPVAMYYSVKAFEAAHLSDADVPKTYEQLVEVAGKLTDKKTYGAMFEPGKGGYEVFTWYPFMWMGGGDITGPDGKTSAFNSPGTVAALKLWKDLVEKGYAPREVLSGGAWDLAGNMGAGYCAMQNCGIWGLSAMKTGAPDTPFGVFKLPTPTADAKPVTVAGGWAFAVNAKGKDPESAAKFAVWALGGDDAACKQRMLDWVTKAKTDMPPRKSVADLGVAQGAYAEGPLRVFAQEILPTARGEPRTPPEVWNLITDAIQACMLNGEDPATVAQTTDQKINSFLATYSGARIV